MSWIWLTSLTTSFLPLNSCRCIFSTALFAISSVANSRIPHPRGLSFSSLKSSTYVTSPTSSLKLHRYLRFLWSVILSHLMEFIFCCWILDPKSYRNMSFISCHFISKGILETNILLSGGARLLLPFVPDVPGPPLRPLPRSCLSPPRPPLLSSLRSTGELEDGQKW